MEDILASIRRILAEDDPPPGAEEQDGGTPPAEGEGVFVLDSSMRKPGEPEPQPAGPEANATGDAKATGKKPEADKPAAGKSSTAPAVAKLTPAPAPAPPKQETKAAPVTSATDAGPASARAAVKQLSPEVSLEDAVRAAFEPAIKEWLDAALPRLVERMVRTEVERIVGGAVR